VKHTSVARAAALCAAALSLTLAACSADPLAAQFREGSGKQYIAGDGTITEYAASDRGAAITFSGTTTEGGSYSSRDAAGQVQVVNFWYAGCAPCRAEAPLLQKVADATTASGVRFIGVNVRDQSPTVTAFEKTYGVTYPSIIDIDTGAVQLAFAGKVPPAAVPTTIVLDRTGRIAARILGQVAAESILQAIINRVVSEPA